MLAGGESCLPAGRLSLTGPEQSLLTAVPGASSFQADGLKANITDQSCLFPLIGNRAYGGNRAERRSFRVRLGRILGKRWAGMGAGWELRGGLDGGPKARLVVGGGPVQWGGLEGFRKMLPSWVFTAPGSPFQIRLQMLRSSECFPTAPLSSCICGQAPAGKQGWGTAQVLREAGRAQRSGK